MRESKELVRLIYRHIRQELTSDEASELQAWIHESEKNRLFFERAVDANQLMEEIHSREEQDLFINEDKAWEKFQSLEQRTPTNTVKVFRIRWWKYAAAVILLLVCVTYFIMLRNEKGESIVKTENANKAISDKEPGKDGAILKLADGREIVLDNAANGLLVQQGKSEVVKNDGMLSYSSSTSKGEIFYNTLSTPRGRQYQLLLPDGSKVWLNAGSSITYPTAFVGKERAIQVTGEIFMDVTKDANRPFKVSVNGLIVEVLGTQFNINSYSDEGEMKTTLVEGKVKIASGSSLAMLAPGQQAILMQDQGDNQIKIVKDADIEAATAWKNGYFMFRNNNLETIMRQLARWYDMEVVYTGSPLKRRFNGTIPRNINLSQVLEILASSNVNFKIQDKKLIVSP